jgi:uncharacterized membrane protein YedE/YeeE
MIRETIQNNGPLALALGGLVIGFAFGAIVYRTNFCTMGALSDIHNFGDWRRFRSWILAAATGLAGAQVLDAAGVVSLAQSMYLAPSLNWLGNLLGGWMFGFGMVFAGGCASRNLARIGGGDVRSLLTLLVLALFAFMTIGGLLGPLRAAMEQATAISLAPLSAPTQSIGDILAVGTGLARGNGRAIAAAVVLAAALFYCFKDKEFRASPVHIWSGIGIGLCVVAGWAVTGLAFDELAEHPTSPISLTFVRPTADSVEWLQRFTAARIPGFGVTTVFGAILGAFVVAKAMGRFQITTFSDKGDTLRNLMGAVLMGTGGVLARGCTVGQGITGISTMAVGSFLTFVAIAFGGRYGLVVFERWLMADL